MFKQRRIVLMLVGLFALTGCGTSSEEGSGSQTDSTSINTTKTRLQVWGPADEKKIYEYNEAAFNALYPNNQVKLDFGNVGEPEAATNVLADVTTAADIFLYSDDQTSKMVPKGVLAKLPTAYKNKVVARDTAVSVEAATYFGDEEMYAFPITGDNGYYLVYNKKFLNETDVLTLEGIMAKTTADHQLVVDMGNGYYATSFIQYISEISYNPITELHATDFNDTKSLDALQGVINILRDRKDNGFKSVDFNGDALDDLSDANGNKVIAGVTGNWNYSKLVEKLGDDLAITKLPTYKNSKGETVQWGSFAGSKLVGVKSSSKNLTIALAFADFMTSEEAQLYRWQQNGWGPSNKAVLENPLLDGDLGIKALAAQAPYAISQARSVGGLFWDASAAVGNFVMNGPASETSPQTLQAVLDAFVVALTQ